MINLLKKKLINSLENDTVSLLLLNEHVVFRILPLFEYYLVNIFLYIVVKTCNFEVGYIYSFVVLIVSSLNCLFYYTYDFILSCWVENAYISKSSGDYK